jgi:ZIP family zinc transporter
MLSAALFGGLAATSLLLGAALGLTGRVSTRAMGLIMAFGAGALISALAFELTDEAFALGGGDAVAIGLALGAMTYFVGDELIARSIETRRSRRRHGKPDAAQGPKALLLGAILDGIPESVVIGISLLHGKGVSIPIIVAVFLSNFPEALSSAQGMRQEGHSPGKIFGVWVIVVGVSALAAAVGYGVLGGASDNTVGLILAFAGGAVLTMLADTMMPEAFSFGHRATGLLTVLGFASAYLLSAAS